MIKILYFITCLGVGGAEQLLYLTLKNINRQRYKPIVCCIQGGELVSEIERLGIKVFNLNMRSKFDASKLIAFYNFIKRGKFDIVHTHLFHANIIGRIIARLCKVPIVISTQHYAFSYNGSFGILLESLTAKLSDRIIAVSDAAKRFYRSKINVSEESLSVIYNGVDLDIKNEASDSGSNLRKELCLNNDFIISCIGRFAEVKGHSYLLRAIAEVIKTQSKIKLLLVGTGLCGSYLVKLASDLGIKENIIFLDSRRDIPQMLNICNLYVLPSLEEGLSITLLEALAMAKPIIATAVGGNPEVIVNGISGMLVPPKDYNAMARAITEMFENRQKAQYLGINARLRAVEKFDIKENVRKTESLYEGLIKKKGIS